MHDDTAVTIAFLIVALGLATSGSVRSCEQSWNRTHKVGGAAIRHIIIYMALLEAKEELSHLSHSQTLHHLLTVSV